MPVTPFHLGPGALVKGIAPRAVSLTAFTAANIAIDIESVWNLLAGRYPVHATLHTFGVALVAGLAVGGLVGAVGRLLTSRSAELGIRPALVGGLLGGLSHPLLDGVMHADIRPFLPLTGANPLHQIVGLGALHAFCVATGAVGVLMIGWQYYRTTTRRSADNSVPASSGRTK